MVAEQLDKIVKKIWYQMKIQFFIFINDFYFNFNSILTENEIF